jgi:hypothetical protein
LARLKVKRKCVFDEMCLELPLNIKFDVITEETRRTGDSELVKLNQNC